jgi:hypothetical protein
VIRLAHSAAKLFEKADDIARLDIVRRGHQQTQASDLLTLRGARIATYDVERRLPRRRVWRVGWLQRCVIGRRLCRIERLFWVSCC